MERKAFLKTCGMACLGGGSLVALLLEGCASGSKMVNGTIVQSNLQIPVSDFQTSNGHFHQYLVVRHDQLKYPDMRVPLQRDKLYGLVYAMPSSGC
jgi:hypothetical protein